jgi:hypothetical protein
MPTFSEPPRHQIDDTSVWRGQIATPWPRSAPDKRCFIANNYRRLTIADLLPYCYLHADRFELWLSVVRDFETGGGLI